MCGIIGHVAGGITRRVMRRPVPLVQAIRGVESLDDLLDARTSVHVERREAALRPGLQVQFAEIADVIGMEVRQQDRRDSSAGEIQQA